MNKMTSDVDYATIEAFDEATDAIAAQFAEHVSRHVPPFTAFTVPAAEEAKWKDFREAAESYHNRHGRLGTLLTDAFIELIKKNGWEDRVADFTEHYREMEEEEREATAADL